MASVSESPVKTLLDEFRSIAKTERVIGKEFQAGEFTLIPISRVSFGMGGGGGSGGVKGESKGEGGAGGGVWESFVHITPIVLGHGRASMIVRNVR